MARGPAHRPPFDHAHSSRLAVLESTRGSGDTTAIARIVDRRELDTLDQEPAAARAGLAPMTRQSGRWQGTGRIQGATLAGSGADVRQTLRVPALVACRVNADKPARLGGLTAASEPAAVAITAVRRKLARLVSARLADARRRDERLGTPKDARPRRLPGPRAIRRRACPATRCRRYSAANGSSAAEA